MPESTDHKAEALRLLEKLDETPRYVEIDQVELLSFRLADATTVRNLASREHRGEECDRYHSALRAIRGPEDSGPWITIYREAGGGYAGLQAIAEAALSDDEEQE